LEQVFHRLNCDLTSLHKSIEYWLHEKDFIVQSASEPSIIFIQAKKSGKIRALAGASRALFIRIDGEPSKFKVSTGTGKWMQNITATVLTGFLTAGITWVTGSLLTGWQKATERQLWHFILQEVEFLKDSSITHCIYCGVESEMQSRVCSNCGAPRKQ
jgi:hypothetical protein